MASEVEAKLHLVKHAIVHNRTDGALIRLSSPVYGSVQESFERLVQFVQAMYPILGQFLPE